MTSERRSWWWLLPALGVVLVGLYHLYFWSLEHPPGRPPPHGDGDWAMLGYVIGLPVVLLVLVILCVVALVGAHFDRKRLAREAGDA